MEKTAMLQRFMLFALATAVLWAQNESRPVVQKTPVGRTSASSGKEMYWAYCAACHGTDGKGDGPASAALKSRPLDLTDGQGTARAPPGAGGGAEFTAFKLILACPFHVGHDNCQHPLVNVNGCYSIRHHASPWRRGEHAKRYSQAGSRGYRRSQQGDDRRPIIRAEAQHAPGSNRPTISTSPLSSRPRHPAIAMIPVFHGISRAEGPFKQARRPCPTLSFV